MNQIPLCMYFIKRLDKYDVEQIVSLYIPYGSFNRELQFSICVLNINTNLNDIIYS